jgi:hypothetical protein
MEECSPYDFTDVYKLLLKLNGLAVFSVARGLGEIAEGAWGWAWRHKA